MLLSRQTHFGGGTRMFARKTRALVAAVVLSPLLLAQKQISVADCTFVANPDSYPGRAARARSLASGNVRALAFRALANVAADSVSRRNLIDDEIFGTLTLRGAAAPLSTDEEFFRRIAIGAFTLESGWSRERTIRAEDIEATIYSALGIDWTTLRKDNRFGRGYEYVPTSNQDLYGPVNELWGQSVVIAVLDYSARPNAALADSLRHGGH